MPKRKGRGRKAASSRSKSNTPTPPSSSRHPAVPNDNDVKQANVVAAETVTNNPSLNTATSNNDDTTTKTAKEINTNETIKTDTSTKTQPLILTSIKRNGDFECDFCHTDISQVPRIVCAKCIDFDICLECFTTVNYDCKESAAPVETVTKSVTTTTTTSANNCVKGTTTDTISDDTNEHHHHQQQQQLQENHHDSTHGYRVADSTRYFMFPSLRGVEDIGAESNSLIQQHHEQTSYSEKRSLDQMNAIKSDASENNNGDKIQPSKRLKSIHHEKEKNPKDDTISTTNNNNHNKSATDENNDDHKKEHDNISNINAMESAKQLKDKVASTDNNDQTPINEVQVTSNAENDSTITISSETNKEKDTIMTDTDFSAENMNDNEAIESTIIKNGQQQKQFSVTDDMRYMWTVEEDLRLLEAITTCGFGNWADISEEVSSATSNNKTPKRCMERFIDDYLGRYGHILPEYTLVEVTKIKNNESKAELNPTGKESQPAFKVRTTSATDEKSIALRANGREYEVIKTETLPDYDKIWPNPYLPPIPNAKLGGDVGRDLSVRAEQTFLKAVTSVSNEEEAAAIRKEWEKTLNQYGGPTVLPPRAEDVKNLPGSELAGYMPRRGDFDVEWDNEADKLLEDMEFSPNDTKEEREIKIKVIEIYNSRLDDRVQKKKFLVDHDLLDYRKRQKEDRKLPADERDLVNRMRLFARFHTAKEHKTLINNILKAKRIRKEIARLQMYERMGFKTLLDVERFELDSNRKESHRLASRQKEKEELAAMKAAGELLASGPSIIGDEKETYHKQYKNSDRKMRKSINRSQNDVKGELNLENNHSEEVSSKVPENSNAVETTVLVNDENKPLTECEGKGTGDGTVDPSIVANHDPNVLDQKNASSENFDVKKFEGYEMLSSKEAKLCQRLELEPTIYLGAKKSLIQESFTRGLLDDTTKKKKRSVVKIDIEMRDDVVNFILQSGWIPPESVTKAEDDSLSD